MATTVTYSGRTLLEISLRAAYSGERSGGEEAEDKVSVTFAAAGGTAPTLSGFVEGVITATTTPTNILVAHASDPFQGLGSAEYSRGFAPASAKLKLIYFRNTDDTDSVTIARAAANGLPIFDAAGDAITLAPGEVFLLYRKAGTAALTTGSNDALALTASANTPEVFCILGYGP